MIHELDSAAEYSERLRHIQALEEVGINPFPAEPPKRSHQNAQLKADFSNNNSFVNAVPALTELVTQEYTAGHYDGVDLVFNEFINVVRQEPKKKT